MTPIEAEAFAYRLTRLEQDFSEHKRETNMELDRIAERIDKLTLAVVGFALTLAVFGLGIAVALLTAAGGR